MKAIETKTKPQSGLKSPVLGPQIPWLTQRRGPQPFLPGFAGRVGCLVVLGSEWEMAEYSSIADDSLTGRDAPPPVSSRLWIRSGRKDVFK